MSSYISHTVLETQLLRLDTDLKFQFPNTDFSVAGESQYIQVDYLDESTAVEAYSTGAHSRESGIMQVTLYMPQGYGAQPALQLADSIVKLFPVGTLSVDSCCQISIDKKPSVGAGVDVGKYYAVPISINYSSYDLGV